MAERRRIIQIKDVKTTRVRYGRATLSIARCGGFLNQDLGRSIAAFERDELSAEELCEKFVRTRVRAHSPSFDWEKADPERLLALVTEVSDDPAFGRVEPESIAQELGAASEREHEMLRESLQRMRRQLAKQTQFPQGTPVRGIASFPPHLAKMVKPFTTFNSTRAAAIGQEWVSANKGVLDGAGVRRNSFIGIGGIAGVGSAATRIRGIAGVQVADQLGAAIGAHSLVKQIQSTTGTSLLARFSRKGFGVGAKFASNQRELSAAGGLRDSLVGREVGLGRNFLPPGYFKSWTGRAGGLSKLAGATFHHSRLLSGLPDASSLLGDFKDIGDRLQKTIESLKNLLPENWRELESDELRDVIELMKVEGLSLARAPRIEIVRELAAAGSSEQRTEILVRAKAEIITDIERVLAEVDHSKLTLHVEAALQVISAHADGHTAAAQALAATVVSDLVFGPLGAPSFNQASKTFRAADPTDVSMGELALYAVGWSLAYAIERYDDAGPGFNRNKTLHWLGPHYNEANLLMSLLLLAGLIPEIELLLTRHEQRELATTSA